MPTVGESRTARPSDDGECAMLTTMAADVLTVLDAHP